MKYYKSQLEYGFIWQGTVQVPEAVAELKRIQLLWYFHSNLEDAKEPLEEQEEEERLDGRTVLTGTRS